MKRGKDQDRAVAVLVSGGVESAAMLAEALKRYERVYPIYVQKGLKWEKAELSSLKTLLSSFRSDGLAKLTVLNVSVGNLYGRHWSLGKFGTPGAQDPDSAVYLPGRNLLLLSLAGLFCVVRRIPSLWLGVLKGNPFHDARTGFIHEMESLLQETLGFPLRIATPFRELTKAQVIGRYSTLPWEKTFSCLRPRGRRHCGRCQKCAERKNGFRFAGVRDRTPTAR
ncbi:MAG: 7-cyano-7-deazaguanine synthase [Candidatus Omnitrophica bacterium]|nr:7-cyano-7-deazaguanine synthase [Candidatus Omnitrophota bacterium]